MIVFGLTFSTADIRLFSAAGALSILFLSIRVASEIRKRDIFNKAASDFVKSFDIILAKLRKPVVGDNTFFIGENTVHEILKTTFAEQQSAVAKFKRALNGKEIVRFTKCWENYCHPVDDENTCDEEANFYLFSGYISQSGEEEKVLRKKAISHIEHLVSFGKNK